MLDARVLLIEQLELLRLDQAAVAPGQADRLAAGAVDHADDVLLHFAGQHPLDHFHGFGIGHAHALDELALLAQALEQALDLRTATVHHHRVDADQLEHHHILGESLLQRGVSHGVAAVLDHHGLAMELTDIGQRLGEDLGLVAGLDMGQVVGNMGHG